MKKLRLLALTGMLGMAAFVVVPTPTQAQGNAVVERVEMWPEADPDDVASIDSIIEALYEVISGPIGQKRDWDRFRSLFVPEARLIPTGRTPDGVVHNMWSPDEYAEQAAPFLEERGFFETETARTTEQFGQVAHAFSTYDSRWLPEDEEPFDRGINSIQLFNDGERWWIMNIFWAAESSGLSIPDRYFQSRRPNR